VINLHCSRAPEVAAARFVQRTRHPGHPGAGKSKAAKTQATIIPWPCDAELREILGIR
jgi:hypothetical protein